ncbi:DUF1570 domain-containing protein [Calycomorphotria hydatis]|uniref:DUF1570 domain-containing protein n=1 Tax=Calycomorphotria hydatis TaxID=2528027 RepID=A0A517TEU2_9PLAN|nr:DUF1570 domain-containing protein [Calycomorphotria hydatis]QDT66886.1 hypothetical protein V22_41580 [Calycomorphotria hydatis]
MFPNFVNTRSVIVWFLVPIALLCLACSVRAGTKPALIELNTKSATYQGRLVGKDSRTALLMNRAGQLDYVDLRRVTSFRQLAPFRPYSSVELRDQLQREFGKDVEISSERSFMVCGPEGRTKAYLKVLKEVHSNFRRFFHTRGFDIDDLETPLVVVVFPNRSEFVKYGATDDVRVSNSLIGYYLPKTNRIALYDEESSSGTRVSGTGMDTRDTLIHEATHQLAFNMGLHTRYGENPQWIVEGLATVFEAPGIRSSAGGRDIENRINADRLRWFQDYLRRRPKDFVEKFVSSDQLFKTSALDAYAEAWALSFYLLETRPVAYARYLKQIADRDPFTRYSSEERLEDFRAAFGKNATMFEADYLRFLQKL